MKKLLSILFFLPMIGFGQNIDHLDCKFIYKIQLKESIVMCPYLGPKILEVFNKLHPCEINKYDKNEIIVFELDSLYTNQFIKEILLKDVGIPEWSIDYITIE